MSKGETINDEAPACDVMDILVASDIHLGYVEKDPERGDDSFNTFEEILKIAQRKEVDLILLGGDLFHDNKPNAKCIHRCLKLLRQYCMGDKPIRVEFLSDQSENFRHCDFPVVNYEDPNFSISIPVFSIHGNHDDPSGFGRLSTLDICSVTNLINYFGKWTDLKKVEISPLLLRKGNTHVAIYGLSHIKDDRLARLFRDQFVKFWQPQQNAEDWFNIFMCHQNRSDRGLHKYLPEEAIPPFIDFVIWGHEHECRINEEFNAKQAFYVTQPGSPVATSLCEGEAKPKHIGLLQVYKQAHKFTPIKLRTVRPFVFDKVVLSESYLDFGMKTVQENVEAFLKKKVQELIDQSKNKLSGYEKQPKLPLIRLRVEWSSEDQCINPMRFGQVFYQGIVANPTDMLMMRKETMDRKKREEAVDGSVMEEIFEEEIEDLQSILERYYEEVDKSKQLKVLSVKGLGEAVARHVDKKDKSAVTDITHHQVDKTINFLKRRDDVDANTLSEILEEYRIVRLAKAQEELKEAIEVLDSTTRTQVAAIKMDSDNEENGNDSDLNGDAPAAAPKPRGGRGSRGGRGRAAKADAPAPAPARGRGRGRAARGAAPVTPRASRQATTPTKSPTRATRQTTIPTRSPSTRSSNRTRITYDEISDSD